jgi:O-glycosyl hydrolase
VLRNNARIPRGPLAILAAVGMATAMTVVAQAGPALAASTATINAATTFQTITGFGASEGFGQATTIMNAGSTTQQQALNDLFSPTSGAGLTMLRNEIPSDSGGTIEPTAPSSPTATPTYRALGTDEGQEWLSKQAQGLGVNEFFADAWGAPPFMKTNNSDTGGGTLCGVPGATCSSGDWRQAYANYLVQYAKDYQADGVNLAYIGFENEANLAPNYSGMVLTPAQTANFADVFGPTLANSGLSTQLECCATEGWDFASQYASAIEADSTANSFVKVFTSHGYTAPPNSPLPGWSKPVWETEWSTFEGWDPAWDDGSAASGLTWAQHIYTGLTAANLDAFLYWWGSSTPSSNGDNESLIQINGSTVTPSGRLWAFANYSRYVHPGAVRIGSSTSDGNLNLVSFKNTDGSIAIVALNTSSSSDSVTFTLQNSVTSGTATPHLTNSTNNATTQAGIPVSGGAFSATLPARSLVTYVIPSGTGNTVTVTNPGSQTGTVAVAASLQIHATDSAAGQTLTYSATGLPAGLSINSSTGLISGTPTAAATSNVTVTATDGTGASGSASFTWTIGNGGGNTVTVTNPGSQTGTVGTAASLQIMATDSGSGQTLTYSATGLPAGLSINSSTGLISGTPTAAATSNVTVTATDGTGASGSASFTWTIGTGGGACTATYSLVNSWPGGFQAGVTVTNGSTARTSWTVSFTFGGDQKINDLWNGSYTQTGESVTVKNLSYNGSLGAGASTTFGFTGTSTNNAAPTGLTCS